MAEGAVEFLLDKMAILLETEASLLGGIRLELKEIKRDLEFMKSFLRDADQITRRENSSNIVKTWVKQVRDSAYDVEDVIDEFMYYFGHQRRSTGFKDSFCKTIHLPKNLLMRHKLATKLQVIKTQVQAISQRSQQYRFFSHVDCEASGSHSSPRWLNNCGESSFFIEDDDIVGFEKDNELLSGWLVEAESRRTVVSVFGMGGSGKTTLVAKVYKSQSVKRYFVCCAWITVSQTYKIDDLLRRIIKEFFEYDKDLQAPTDLSTMDYRGLVKKIIDYLRRKRYLIVLDDVWKIGLWSEINVALPDCGTGSRVVLTTRIHDIATFCSGAGGRVHQVLPLEDADAWILFCRKALSCDPTKSNDHPCTPELEEVARLILEKCKGLPLAIVTMGGLIASKNMTYIEWKKVYDSMNWELSNNPILELMKGILFLSYSDLPYYLKNCFRYCCVFPEDFRIKRGRLINLWIAEGFVAEKRGMTLEDVADIYLMELISRGMLQVVKRNYSGMPKECVMHDLMRELAISLSEEENFCVIHDEFSSNIEARKDCMNPRRLSTDKGGVESDVDITQLRSLIMFEGETSFHYSSPSLLPASSLWPSSRLKLLRVLDLQDLPITSVPDELGKLFNLRYLNLRNTQVKKLPNSIGELKNLQTLDTSSSKVKALPNGIIRCRSLRYVKTDSFVFNPDVSTYMRVGTQVPVDIWKLKNLQVLDCIEASGDMIKQLGYMTQLRKIGITKVREADEIDLCNTIRKLKLLRSLFIMATNEDEPLRVDALSSSSSPSLLLQALSSIHLAGKLERVPLWLCSLRYLTHLCLRWSRLSEDPLPCLHGLSCLVSLFLITAYDGQQLCFGKGWFLKVKYLAIYHMSQLNEVIIEKEALPNLEKFELGRCKELKMVPLGIEHLTSLQNLTLENMSDELLLRLRGENNIDRPRVRHIPEIDNYYTVPTMQGKGLNYESLS